jgi:NAD(P)-dependent dehydrogenase (short-subunit alcohol dehydrogenase family)
VSWTLADAPDASGRTAVVTGASSGLGLEAAASLALAGAHVVLACRDAGRGAAALAQVRERVPGASAEVMVLDVADLGSVASFADALVAGHPHLDLLVCNAGVMAAPRGSTVDGFETQLGTNHLGHFALAARLFPLLRATPGSRVVWVTSLVRFTGRHARVRDVDPARYDPWAAYSTSKLANAVTGVELDRRLRALGPGEPVPASVLAHPGFTHTDLQHRSAREQKGVLARFFSAAVRSFGMPVSDGVRSILRAALDPGVHSGQVVAPRFVMSGDPHVGRPEARVRDEVEGRRLWALSERATGETFEVR